MYHWTYCVPFHDNSYMHFLEKINRMSGENDYQCTIELHLEDELIRYEILENWKTINRGVN